MTQAEKLERVLENKRTFRNSKLEISNNADSIDVLHSENLKDLVLHSNDYEAGLRSIRRSATSFEDETFHRNKPKNSIVDKLKKVLRVDSDDDTDNLHNKYKETARDREEKLRMFEKQLNIKINSSSRNSSLLLNSYMTTSILFLSILVLLLLSVFLIFKLTTRVESMEDVLETIQDYIEKVTVNNTDLPLMTDRRNPGIIKGRRSKGRSRSAR